MKKGNYFWGFVFGMALVQGSLFAERVQGQVTAINREGSSITVLAQDPSGSVQKSRELTLRSDVRFSGIHSLADLEVGDEIQAEVDKKMFGKEEVKQLISGKSSPTAQPAVFPQSTGGFPSAVSPGSAFSETEETARYQPPAGSQFSAKDELASDSAQTAY